MPDGLVIGVHSRTGSPRSRLPPRRGPVSRRTIALVIPVAGGETQAPTARRERDSEAADEDDRATLRAAVAANARTSAASGPHRMPVCRLAATSQRRVRAAAGAGPHCGTAPRAAPTSRQHTRVLQRPAITGPCSWVLEQRLAARAARAVGSLFGRPREQPRPEGPQHRQGAPADQFGDRGARNRARVVGCRRCPRGGAPVAPGRKSAATRQVVRSISTVPRTPATPCLRGARWCRPAPRAAGGHAADSRRRRRCYTPSRQMRGRHPRRMRRATTPRGSTTRCSVSGPRSSSSSR